MSSTTVTALRRRRREYGLFALLVAPNLLVIAVFAYWPIIYNAFLSLTDWNMIAARPTFVGLANYGRTLTDPAFRGGMYWHAATSLEDGRVLVTGGNDDLSCDALNAAELFEHASGTFRGVAGMSSGRDGHTGAPEHGLGRKRLDRASRRIRRCANCEIGRGKDARRA